MKKSKLFKALVSVPLAFALGACSANNADQAESSSPASAAAYHKITATEAKSMMDGGKPYILVDVRTESEYRDSRINGAVLIPYDEIKARAAAELPDKNAVILVYCKTGGRSKAAADTLVSLGYNNVYDIAGGITGWPYDKVSG